ncbi:MAG: hypothetical protein WEG36_12345 [Gemmatimonadota bacterium]
MTTRPRRRVRADQPSPVEWDWLLAAPDCNPFLGFKGGVLSTPERLWRLWRELESEIRAAWRTTPPAKLPFGHPARADSTPPREG